MTAAAPAKAPPKETWKDWLPEGMADPPDESLLTRDQLIDELHDRGVEVTSRMLTRWQEAGIVPYGSRRWRDGRPAVLYPDWMVDALAQLRHLQDKGLALQKIADLRLLRMWPLMHVSWRDPLFEPREAARRGLAIYAAARRRLFNEPIGGVLIQFTDGTEQILSDDDFPLPPVDE